MKTAEQKRSKGEIEEHRKRESAEETEKEGGRNSRRERKR